VIEPGANLGSGVLIVGHGHIGHHACIGASSTVINPTVTPHQVVSPKALLGDPTQPMAQSSVDRATTGNGAMAFADTELPLVATPQPSIPGPSIPPDPPGGIQGIEPPSPAAESGLEAESGLSQASADHLPPNGLAPSSQQDGPSSAPVLANGAHVYGKKQVSQLLETLFPHRRSLNGSAPEDRT
jgi:carbon dioxide concentrating mechanism protein CcmN